MASLRTTKETVRVYPVRHAHGTECQHQSDDDPFEQDYDIGDHWTRELLTSVCVAHKAQIFSRGKGETALVVTAKDVATLQRVRERFLELIEPLHLAMAHAASDFFVKTLKSEPMNLPPLKLPG